MNLSTVTSDGQFSFTLLEFSGHCLPGLPLNLVLISASLCLILGFCFSYTDHLTIVIGCRQWSYANPIPTPKMVSLSNSSGWPRTLFID